MYGDYVVGVPRQERRIVMPCIFDVKPEDRHCKYCMAVFCDERQPKSVKTFATNKAQKGE